MRLFSKFIISVIRTIRNNFVKNFRKGGNVRATYRRYAELRDEHGMSDYKVAKETNIAASTISDWKNGLSVPKADKLVLIARLLSVTVEDLFEEA